MFLKDSGVRVLPETNRIGRLISLPRAKCLPKDRSTARRRPRQSCTGAG